MKIAGLTAWIVTVCGGGKRQSSLVLCCGAFSASVCRNSQKFLKICKDNLW